jgi:hypothetical protein
MTVRSVPRRRFRPPRRLEDDGTLNWVPVYTALPPRGRDNLSMSFKRQMLTANPGYKTRDLVVGG